MIHLIRVLSGRLAIILALEAVTAWILMMVGHTLWSKNISTGGMITTMIIMSVTIFAYQERKLGSNVQWLTTLPLAKWQVWMLSYFIRFSAVLLMFALAVAITLFLPPRVTYQNESIPFVIDFFKSLVESIKSYISLYGWQFKDAGSHTLNNSMFFVMVAGVIHFYAGVLRFTSTQGRVLNIVILISSLWGGFMLLAVGNASIFMFEAFIMLIAFCFMIFSTLKHLHMPKRNVWPAAAVIACGFGLLIGPQAVKAGKNLKTGKTIDEFVDAHRYLGPVVKISEPMFHHAFRLPGDSWKIRELARMYTKDKNWDYEPMLPAEGDKLFNFLDTLKAQTNYDSAIATLMLVKPETLAPRHIATFSKHLESLKPELIREDDTYRVAASMAKAAVSSQQLKSWLASDSEDLRFAAIAYPRFNPSESVWRLLTRHYANAKRDEREAIRVTASIIRGAWTPSEDMAKLNDASLFNEKANRSLCTKSLKMLICQTNGQCQNAPTPEVEECFAKSGISYPTLNSCMYTYGLNSRHDQRRRLIAQGWIHPAEVSSGIVAGIVCDGEY